MTSFLLRALPFSLYDFEDESSQNISADNADCEDRPMIEITKPLNEQDLESKSSGEIAPIEIAFTASAGVFVYQMGVAAYLQNHFDLSDCHFSGCSGGAWAATLLASGTDVRLAWNVMKEVVAKLMKKTYWYSAYGKYAMAVTQTIEQLWKHEEKDILQKIVGNNLSIVATEFPSMRAQQFTQWDSIEDLSTTMLASAMVPFALSGWPFISYRGKWYIDGAFANFKGVKCEKYNTWSDVWYHSSNMARNFIYGGVEKAVGCVSSTWTAKTISFLEYYLPRYVDSPHPAIAAPNCLSRCRRMSADLDANSYDSPRQLIVRPWQWRTPGISSYNLSADLNAHARRFEQGYEDAQCHHHELASLLRPKPFTSC